MQSQVVSMDATLAQFGMTDIVRRLQGSTLDAFGLGPRECPHRVIAAGPYWRLRDYADQDSSQDARPVVLIVAAPIKRPYIWDLAAPVSVIRHCLRQGLHVHLLEWMPAPHDGEDNGLLEYADAIGECVERISGASRAGPFLFGHSLGGTLAALFAALSPERLRGLVLLSAPLCFRPQTSRFRDALVSLVPALPEGGPYPGSLLSHLSALAAPGTFVWSRLVDAACSIADHHALDIHGRVERWALDEVPLPGRLVREIIEWLYREDRFCRGTLPMRQRLLGPRDVRLPTLAVVNTADEVAPTASVIPFADAMATADVRLIDYSGEAGVGLQHLGILIGRAAHAQIWPEIFAWLEARAASADRPALLPAGHSRPISDSLRE
jgi:polyhydroxyalkanoate synthase subunit PhaC